MTTPTKTPAQPAQTETAGISKSVSTSPEHRKFTVDEYYRMAEVGILRPDERVELIDGEIILMAPVGPQHVWTVNLWNRTLAQLVIEGRVIVQIQSPIHLGSNSQPEPDIVLLIPQAQNNPGALPGPADILLIIEVSDTTLSYDRGTKANLYAGANIPETWVLNLPEDCIESFTEPSPEGYAQHDTYRRGDKISPSTLPDLQFAVEDLLPPAVEEPEAPEAQPEAQNEGEPQA